MIRTYVKEVYGHRYMARFSLFSLRHRYEGNFDEVFFSGLPVVMTSPPQHSKSVFTSPTQKTETTPSSRVSTGGVRSTSRVSSSRKASSTPSLPEATTDGAKPLVESFEQTVSADNLSAKQVRMF